MRVAGKPTLFWTTGCGRYFSLSALRWSTGFFVLTCLDWSVEDKRFAHKQQRTGSEANSSKRTGKKTWLPNSSEHVDLNQKHPKAKRRTQSQFYLTQIFTSFTPKPRPNHVTDPLTVQEGLDQRFKLTAWDDSKYLLKMLKKQHCQYFLLSHELLLTDFQASHGLRYLHMYQMYIISTMNHMI